MFYIGLKRESMKKPSCLKSQGMKHHLVDLYQVCSNYAPGAASPSRLQTEIVKIMPLGQNIDPPGVSCFT